MDFANLDEIYVRAEATNEEEDLRTSEALLPSSHDQGDSEPAELPSYRTEASSQPPSGQPGTITILGLEMPEPAPFEIPVSWERVRDDIPAELLRTPDVPMSKSEIRSVASEMSAKLNQEFDQAFDLFMNVVLVSNPGWVDGSLDLYLLDWLSDLGAGEGIGDAPSSIQLAGSIVITPEAQILAQRLEIGRLQRERDAVEAILESLFYRVLAEEAPASPAITDRDEEPDAVQAEAGPSADLPPAGPVSEDAVVAISENWARRSAQALDEGRKREAVLSALKGLPEDVSDAQLDAEYHPAHLALYSAARADIITLPLGPADPVTRLLISATPDRERALLHATGKEDGSSRFELWNADSQEMIAVLDDGASNSQYGGFGTEALDFTRAGDRLALGNGEGHVFVFDTRDGGLIKRLGPIARPQREILTPVMFRSMEFSPSGSYLVATTMIPSAFTVWRTDTLQPVLSWGDADFQRIAGVGRNRAHVAAHFLDDDTLCMTVIRLAPAPMDMISPALPAEEIVLGFLDVTSGRFEEIYRDDRGNQTLPNSYCSPERKWAALGYVEFGLGGTTHGGAQRLDVIDLEAASEITHAVRPSVGGMGGRVYFDDDAGLMALPGMQGWTFFDLNSGEFVDQPGAVRGFQLFYPYLAQSVAFISSAGLVYLGDKIWEQVPTGLELMASAISGLSDEERAELGRERVGTHSSQAGVQEELTVASENWARRSANLLNQGYRIPAIVAALKGLPEVPSEKELEAFAPAHLALYTAYRAQTVRLPLTGHVSPDSLTHSGGGCLQISLDLRRVLTCNWLENGDAVVDLWDPDNDRLVARLVREDRFGRHRSGFPSMEFSPDSRLVAMEDLDGSIRIHSAEDGGLVAEMPFLPPEQSDKQYRRPHIEFGPTSRYIVALANRELRVWSLPERSLKFTLTSPFMTGPHFANDDHLCVVTSESTSGGDLVVVNVETGRIISRYRLDDVLNPHGAVSTRCSPDLKKATAEYSIQIDGRSARRMDLFSLEGGIRKLMALDYGRLAGALFDPTSRYLISPFELNQGGWGTFDTAAGEFVDHPTALAGYKRMLPLAYNSSDKVEALGHVVPMMPFTLIRSATKMATIWRDVPQGRDLIAAALAELNDEQREDVAAERIGKD